MEPSIEQDNHLQCFLTRGPKGQKSMFLLLVNGAFISHLILMGFYFNEFFRKITFGKMHSIIMWQLPFLT